MAVGQAPIASPTVISIMLVIFAAGVVSTRRLQRNYDRYYNTQMAPKGETIPADAPGE